MIAALLFGLLAHASPAPQYAEQAHQDLSGNQLDVLNDVFGDLGAQVLEHSEDHIVKNEVGLTAPDDYQEASNEKLSSVATTEVDNVFENCADYTASQGYECVPYYQCNNGTIITDGGGLIDIRNGFGILSPEDSKCPGFLDVCCLDPDFIPPPPPPIVKHVPKCRQRSWLRRRRRPSGGEPLPVRRLPDRPQRAPHRRPLRSQVPSGAEQVEGAVWGVGHAEPDRAASSPGPCCPST